MGNASKISFFSLLLVLAALLTGTGSGFPTHESGFHTSRFTDQLPVADDTIHATPVPALLLSENVVENDSEIEPKESGFPAFSLITGDPYGIQTYLRKSKLILISLKLRDLIYPFHTHL